MSFKVNWTRHRRLRLLEHLAGATGICQHGFALQDRASLEAFTPGAPEEEPEVICAICGLPKRVVRIVHDPDWRAPGSLRNLSLSAAMARSLTDAFQGLPFPGGGRRVCPPRLDFCT